mgnify:FL=1
MSILICVDKVLSPFILHESISPGLALLVSNEFHRFDNTILLELKLNGSLGCLKFQSGNYKGLVGIRR